MPFSMPVQQTNVAKWIACKSILGNHHLLVILLSTLSAIRAPEARSRLLLHALSHLLAWACCLSKAPATQRRMFTIASACGILSWVLRFMVHQSLLMQEHLPPVFERAFTTSTIVYAGDAFVASLEMAYALMWVPGVLVTVLLAAHLRAYYQIVKRVGQPSLITTAAWVLADFALPHLLHHYMHKAAQLREAQERSQATSRAAGTPEAASCKQAPASGSDKGERHGTNGRGACALARADGIGEPCVSSERAATAGPEVAEDKADGRPVMSGTRAMQVASPHALAPSTQVLKALHNAQALQQRASSQYTYRSRLLQPQALMIKLKDTEPEQLRQDVIAAVNTAMNQGRAGMLTVRAGVRRGCTLLTIDLMQRSGHQQAAQPPDSVFPVGCLWQTDVQALLGSLLVPGTAIPDGAVAYVQMGGQEVQATWRQGTATWMVTEVAGDNQMAGRSLTASLLFVDHPVVRLPPQASPASAGSSGSSSMHRTTLLLRMSHPASALAFLGSDQSSSAPPDPPSSIDGAPVSVQCVARGCWGTCLPVAVVGVEEVAWEDDDNSKGAVAAVQLDVDLSQAPSAGSVQLELWCGRALLASAPLLLLPRASDSSSQDVKVDVVLQELQQCLEQQAWGAVHKQGGTAAHGQLATAGAAALVTDLGQVLYSLDCIERHELSAGAAASLATVTSSSSDPASWGGIVSSLAAQHASDPADVASMLALAEGLLEFAQTEGLKQTTALLTGSVAALQRQLERLQITAASPPSTGKADLAAEKSSPGKEGLRLRQHVDVASPPPTTADTTAPLAAPDDSALQVPAATPSGQRTPAAQQHLQTTLHWPLLLQCARHALTGFPTPQTEDSYRHWVAGRWRSVTVTHGCLMVLWVISSTSRTLMLDGWQAGAADLPFYLLVAAPCLATAVLAVNKRYTWLQAVQVSSAVGRAAAAALVACGVLALPPPYPGICKIRLGTWSEMIFRPLVEPLCFPALLAAHTILMGYDIALLHICSRPVHLMLPQVLLFRLCAVAFGTGVDLVRRCVFLQHHQQNNQQLLSQKKVA